MTSFHVRPYTEKDADAWEAFVQACPEATFFHRIGWKRVLEQCFGHRTHYLVAEGPNGIAAILPLAEVKSFLFGHALVSLPFCTLAGVAAMEAAAVEPLHEAAEKLAAKLRVEHLELRNASPRTAGWPSQDLYAAFRKPILPDVEANLRAVPRKQRAMIRKGIGNGLASRVDENVDTFFALYADNVHRHGTPPLSKRYFEALRAEFGRDVEVLTVTDPQGAPVSSVFSFYFKDEVLPYYAGDTLSARDLAANDFKYWELMRRACVLGVRTFDYGRSKRGTGPYDFKRNWGFEPAPLAYEYRLIRRTSIPQNNPLNPKYRALIALWRRLPIGVANALGPHLVKSLG